MHNLVGQVLTHMSWPIAMVASAAIVLLLNVIDDYWSLAHQFGIVVIYIAALAAHIAQLTFSRRHSHHYWAPTFPAEVRQLRPWSCARLDTSTFTFQVSFKYCFCRP